jgi:hypothetical protein
MINKGMGALNSPIDVRTFTYTAQPTKANWSGGKRWLVKDIDDQSKVGICTGMSLSKYATKVYKVKMSPEFQYLCQKKFYDMNWDEGSSAFHALKVGKDIGFLPESEWKFTKKKDRDLPYHEYVKKLQAVSDKDIEKLKKKAAKYKLLAYAYVAPERDLMANAIDNSEYGIITRYVLGNEWWTEPLQPLRPAKNPVSGHLVTDTNYAGNSFRIANHWGTDWADKGTAYRIHSQYKPTECWIPYFKKLPDTVAKQIEKRKSTYGKVMDMVQKLLVLIRIA